MSKANFWRMELILVIVLLGVLASGAGLLITRPIAAYNDQLRRQQLVDQGEMALRNISLDHGLRSSAPTLTIDIAIQRANLAEERQKLTESDLSQEQMEKFLELMKNLD